MSLSTEFFIVVDIEAAGPIPGEFSMLSLGAATLTQPEETFYIELQPDSEKFLPDALAIRPLRIAIATTRRTRSLAEYHAANPMEITAEQLGLLNQIETGTVLRSGTRIKTVVRR